MEIEGVEMIKTAAPVSAEPSQEEGVDESGVLDSER